MEARGRIRASNVRPVGHRQLIRWLLGWHVAAVGIGGTGSHGTGAQHCRHSALRGAAQLGNTSSTAPNWHHCAANWAGLSVWPGRLRQMLAPLLTARGGQGRTVFVEE